MKEIIEMKIQSNHNFNANISFKAKYCEPKYFLDVTNMIDSLKIGNKFQKSYDTLNGYLGEEKTNQYLQFLEEKGIRQDNVGDIFLNSKEIRLVKKHTKKIFSMYMQFGKELSEPEKKVLSTNYSSEIDLLFETIKNIVDNSKEISPKTIQNSAKRLQDIANTQKLISRNLLG